MNSDLLIPSHKPIFFNIKSINSPLNKKYRILPYTQKILDNENKVFDLIHYLGNQKKFNQLKNIYTEEQNQIKKEIFVQKNKEKFFKNSSVINIETFDTNKINIHSPMSILEGNFISGLIHHSKNKQKKRNKMIEFKKRNKFLFKRAAMSYDNFFNRKKINLKQNVGLVEENKEISDNSVYNKEITKLKKRLNHASIINLLDEELPDNLENKKEYRKTINSIFFRPYNNLTKDQKSLSTDNFFGIQSKKIKINGNKLQILNLKHKKLSKLFFSKLFKEENKIIDNLNEINNNILDMKHSYHSDNTVNGFSYSTFRTPRKHNNYKAIKENLTSFQKNIYEFPVVNKFIYGSRNPLTIFSKTKIKSKVDSNLSE